MLPTIQLYTFPPTQNAVRTEIALREKQLPFEKIAVDLRKGGHRQRLRLPAIAVRRVERWLADAPWPAAAPGPLWGAMAKHGCSVVRRGISANAPYQICRRYGLPPPHSWRHLGAQWALQDGRGAGVPASVSELQSLLGHRGTTATVHYVQRSTDTAAELRERWSDYLDGLD